MSDTPLDRDEFPVTEQRCFLNHAAVGPLPRVAVAATDEVSTAFMREGSEAMERMEGQAERVRTSMASIMGVPTDDVAFVKNTTEGLGFVASGLEWQPGDRVVVPDREFPSTIYPWLALEARDVQVDRIEPTGASGSLPIETFAQALEERATKLVACSWVQFGTGWRTDLAALADLCHEHGALLCVDAIQGLGVVPAHLKEWGVDFAAADAHKWLLGPSGCGVLYVARQHREDLRVLEPGWNSVAHREEWDNLTLDLDSTARRFEGGTLNLAGIIAMGASAELLIAAGPDRIWQHVEELCRLAAVGLAESGAEILSDRSLDGRSAILTFRVPNQEPERVCEVLREQGIICSPRGGGIRVSPHAYNTPDEIEQLTKAVADLAPAPKKAERLPPQKQGPMRRPADW